MRSEDAVSYVRHALLGKSKKFFKDLFGKGPECLNVRISENAVIMEFSGVLRNTELGLVRERPEMAVQVANYRRALFDYAKISILGEFEDFLQRKIVNAVFDLNLQTDQAVVLLLLDKPV